MIIFSIKSFLYEMKRRLFSIKYTIYFVWVILSFIHFTEHQTYSPYVVFYALTLFTGFRFPTNTLFNVLPEDVTFEKRYLSLQIFLFFLTNLLILGAYFMIASLFSFTDTLKCHASYLSIYFLILLLLSIVNVFTSHHGSALHRGEPYYIFAILYVAVLCILAIIPLYVDDLPVLKAIYNALTICLLLSLPFQINLFTRFVSPESPDTTVTRRI